MQVQSLVRELKSHKLRGVAKKTKTKTTRGWKGGEEKGSALLNPLEVTSTRSEGAATMWGRYNNNGHPSSRLHSVIRSSHQHSEQRCRYLEDRVLFAHPSSHKLWAVVPGKHAQLSARGWGRRMGSFYCAKSQN